MLLTEIPPSGNLTQWFYNLFNQIKSENEATAPPPVANDQAGAGTGSVAHGPVSPVISSHITVPNNALQADASKQSQAAAAGVSYLTASYGTMLLEAELAVPGPPGPFAVLPLESGGEPSAPPTAAESTAAVAASQAAEAYQVSVRTQSNQQSPGLSSSS